MLLRNPVEKSNVAAIVELYLQGVALPEIARRVGVSYPYVTKIVSVGEDNAEAAMEMYEQGLSISQVAARLSLPVVEVFKFLKAEFRVSSREVAAEIVRLYKAGDSSLEISNATTVRQPEVLKILHAAGVRMRPAGHERDSRIETDDEAIARDYETMSLRQLEKKYGVSVHALRDRLASKGVQMRPRAQRATDAAMEAEIASDFRRGMTKKEIADKFGISHMTVGRVLARLGLAHVR